MRKLKIQKYKGIFLLFIGKDNFTRNFTVTLIKEMKKFMLLYIFVNKTLQRETVINNFYTQGLKGSIRSVGDVVK